MAPRERYGRAPKQHEAVKRRWTGEEDPLADIREWGVARGIEAREEKCGAGSEAERGSDEIEGINGTVLSDQGVKEILERGR